MHHLLLHAGRDILHVDPRPSEVASPQTQRAVLGGGGEHGAGGIPGDPPHVGLGGALHGLRGHVLQRAVLFPVELVDLEGGLSARCGDQVVRSAHRRSPRDVMDWVVVLAQLALLQYIRNRE